MSSSNVAPPPPTTDETSSGEAVDEAMPDVASLFRRVAQNVCDIALWLDERLNVRRALWVGARFRWLDAAAARGLPLWELFADDGAALRQAFQGEQGPPKGVQRFEVTLLGSDEHRRWLELRVIPEGDANEPLRGYLAVGRDITEAQAIETEMRRLATTDALTGAQHYHRLVEQASHEFRRSRRYKRPFSLLLIDIDGFRKTNETHGRLAGDKALCTLVNVCKEKLRNVDLVGRFGGDEFAVVLPETAVEGAQVAAERIRSGVEEAIIEHAGGEFRITVSVGIASMSDGDTTIEALLFRADSALADAKYEGPNRALVAEDAQQF